MACCGALSVALVLVIVAALIFGSSFAVWVRLSCCGVNFGHAAPLVWLMLWCWFGTCCGFGLARVAALAKVPIVAGADKANGQTVVRASTEVGLERALGSEV